MDPITSGLEPGASGRAVANLHEGLLLLMDRQTLDLPGHVLEELRAGLIPEREGRTFADATSKIVSIFQEQRGLEVHGVVDEETARALNQWLEELGAFEERPPDPQTGRTLAGTVLHVAGVPAADVALRLYRREFGGTASLVTEAVTGVDGTYRFDYDPGARGWSVEVRAVAPDGAETVLSTPLDSLSGRTAARVDLVAPAALVSTPAEYRRLVDDVAPHVGEVTTLGKAREADGRRDLTGLATATGWDARLMALAADAQKVSQGSELSAEGLYGLFRAGLPREPVALAQIDHDTVRSALTHLRERGVVSMDAAEVGEFVDSFGRFADATRLSATAPGSYSSYSELLDASLDGETKVRFATAFFGQVTQDGAQAGSIWAAARAAGVDEPAVARLQWQGKLAYLAGNSAPVTRTLMERLSSGPQGAEQQLSSPAALVADGFHRGDRWREAVRSLVDDGTDLDTLIPASYAGDTSEARLDAYAEDMARKIRLSYPTQVVTQLVGSGDLAVGTAAPVTVRLLEEASAAGFELGRNSVSAFLEESHLTVTGLDQDDLETATEVVKTLHRVYQITPGDDAMAVLLDLGLTSAYDVTSLTYERFARLYEIGYLDRFGDRPTGPQTRLVWRKAHQVAAMSYNLFGVVKKVDSDPEVLAISGAAAARSAEVSNLKAALKGSPTMESLFGSLDYAGCAHCRSVLSPAAYLVDLLGFLEGESAAWATFLSDWQTRNGQAYSDRYLNPYDALVARRPELPHLQLDCANTHTELPYIDLVNEVLEYHVAHGALAPQAAHDSGDATSESLLGEPANVIAAAYGKLREATYPIGLPFDLWTETVRRFATHAEVAMPTLLDTFRSTDALIDATVPYDRVTVFAEQLGLSTSELALLTDPDPLASWWELYGYPDAAGATTAATDPDSGQRLDLNSAKALSRRLGLTYSELVELVQTAFVNPGLARQPLLSKLHLAMSTVRWFLDAANAAFLQANVDLLAESLTDAQQDRKDATSASDWTKLTDLAAVAARVDAYAAAHGLTPGEVRDQLAAIPAGKVLVLADPDTGASFDQTILRFADGTAADPATFIRLSWFVRLWRTLGWSIAEVDTVLQRFTPVDAAGELVHSQRPLRTAVTYLAHLVTLAQRLGMSGASRARLLTLWGPLATHGPDSPYAIAFLKRRGAGIDPVFDHPFADYLAPAWVAAQAAGKPPEFALVKGHLAALQGALGLSAAQVATVLADVGTSVDAAALTLENVSALARYSVLAKALRLKVEDLVTLRSLSGLDPFRALATGPLTDLDQDHPYTQTLAFVDLATTLRAAGLTVAQLERWLRGRHPAGTGSDPAGRGAADTALLVGLSDQLRALRVAVVVPEDTAGLTEQGLAELLGQVLPAPVVGRYLSMLRWEEALSETTRDFFDSELLRRVVGDGIFTGFLEATDYPALFEPPAGLVAVLPDDTEEQAAAKREANASVVAAETARRRSRTAEAFGAARLAALSSALVTDVLARTLDADPALVAALLADTSLLDVGGKPLREELVALVTDGFDASFFVSDDATGPRQDTPPLVADFDSAARPATDSGGTDLPPANSADFQGHVVADRAGPHRFTVELEKAGASARLILPHLPDPVFLDGTAGADGDVVGDDAGAVLHLEAGVPYELRLEARDLSGGTVRVRVHSAALPAAPLARLRHYPASTLGSATDALAGLRTSVELLSVLGLGLRETRHLLGHPAQFGGLVLGDLPVAPVGDTAAEVAAARSRFSAVVRLAQYVVLRNELDVGGDELVAVFEAAGSANDPLAVAERLADVLRRTPEAVSTTIELLWPGGVRIDDDLLVRRLWEVLALAERFGTTPERVRGWTGVVDLSRDEPARAALAADIRETLKAVYDDSTWVTAVKPVSDGLRARQRDALVAFVLHEEGLSRVEQLYEHLLLDPLMEPVVTTSRIRAALGSVQLFVTRVLLNLERQVHPSAIINADQWEWMKRYRVWEANRKIWLFPENWLEPEFRGDKSDLFSELEGSLLASDVSPDVVEDAFLGYVRKLEELARLDIVAMHLEDDVDYTRNTLHVIGRTFAQPHKYYHRRYANRLWSAWEPVDVAVEGDHVMPVVWRDRLYLFWLTFIEEGQASGAGAVDVTKPVPLPTVDRVVEVQLHWSELVEGAWSTPRTTGYDLPADQRLRAKVAPGFTAKSVPVWVSVVPQPSVGSGTANLATAAGVYLNLGAPFAKAFHLVSRNSPPELTPTRPQPKTPFVVGTDSGKVRPTSYVGSPGKLSVSLRTRISSEPAPDLPVTLDVLGSTGQFTLLPVNNSITLGVSEEAYAGADDPAAVQAALTSSIGEIESLMKPAFYSDHRTTVFLEPEVVERTIEEWQEWVTTTPVPDTSKPPWLDDDRWWQEAVKPWFPEPLQVEPDFGFVDPLHDPADLYGPGLPYSLIQHVAPQDWVTSPHTGLVYDGQVLGAAGVVDVALVGTLGAAALGDAVTIPVTAGSGIAADQVLVSTAGLDAGVIASVAGAGVLLVGQSGLNAAIHDTVGPGGLGFLDGPGGGAPTGIFGRSL